MENKKVELEKIEKQNRILGKLQEINSLVAIFNLEQNEKAEDILVKNSNYKRKLEKDELEIAIVGLEKAGKSTFANALIENDILPSAPERCTFTSTRLTFGDNRAIIEFYTKDEFNEIFQGMLRDIEYSNYENITFENLSLNEFKRYFDSLEESNSNLYKNHKGKTDEEIEDILANKVKLSQLLSGGVREFKGDELNSEEFKSFIRGENEGKDTARPRSVKKIEIQSSKLQKLKNAIIYDVPGFDSPTRIHERQTLERLKSADAIILVTNIGTNPSLVGTQLNTITKNTDDDGIKLNEKLFVFGNKIDLAEDKNYAHNEKILRRDVKKYNLAKDERVFIGSAKNYLNSKNNNIKFDFSLGVDEIYKSLVEYNNTERFKVLQRRIEKNEIETQKIKTDILEKFVLNEDDVFINEKRRNEIILEAQKEIEKKLSDNLEQLKFDLKHEILDEEYFSTQFNEKIQEENLFNEINKDFIDRIEIKTADTITRDLAPEKINDYSRSELHNNFLLQFSTLIDDMTDEKANEIKKRIVESFVKAIGDIDKEKAEQFIDNISSKVGYHKGKFNFLIERFSRDIFDILIARYLFSIGRKNKFEEAKKEFIYLDSFYGDNETMIGMLLNGDKNKIGTIDYIKDGAMRSLNILSKFSKKADIIKKTIDFLGRKDSFENSKIEEKISATKEEIVSEINTDIKNLKEILQKAVVPAINLELAFANSVDKQIQTILKSLNSKEFRSFLSEILIHLKRSEIEMLDAQIKQYQKVKELLEEIQ